MATQRTTGTTTRSTSRAKTTSSAEPEPAETAQQPDENVEVRGTGPDGEWRAETHGESPAERPKAEF